MALIVHHGSRLDRVAGVLADVLAEHPPADVFTPEIVVVPTAGVRDLFIRTAAHRLGVSANIEFPFPGRFVASALGLDPARVADDPWHVDRLTWSVLAVLDAGTVEVPGWGQANRTGRSRRYRFARRLADLLDRYAANRPQLIQQWAIGVPGDGTVRAGGPTPGGLELAGQLEPAQLWQFELWRAVRAHIGTAGTAERLPELVERLRSGELAADLPDRVLWCGLNGITPSRLDVVTALAVHRDVHLGVVHPSGAWWDHTPPIERADRLVLRARRPESPGNDVGHPLVRSWGRARAELAGMLRGVAGASIVVVPDAAPAPTLLAHLQADITADRPPRRFDGGDDATVQVHACHGVTRQLEVLRDVLGHLFVTDPTLQPHDVVVLCPDIERFEPFAAAVFERGALPVPLTVTDLSLGAENPVAAALRSVVNGVSGRCTALDLLDIASLEPVRTAVGLTIDDVEKLSGWVADLGISWGLDADHRLDVLDTNLPGGTWESLTQTLFAGAVLPAPVARRVTVGGAEVVPYDDMPADAARTAGRVAELIARLRCVRALFAVDRPALEWCDVFHETVRLVGGVDQHDPGAAWQLGEVADAIESVRASIVASPADAAVLHPADALAIVDDLVAESGGRLRTRSGRVTLTGLTPLRNVPARVVCLLGFDEVSLRAGGGDGDDLLATHPCVGEPDRRAERRQVVLDALLAARDRFVVVCDGNDITTNRRVRFPIALSELLDVVELSVNGHVVGDDHDATAVVRHPLRAFDPRNFSIGDPFSFDATMLAAAATVADIDAVTTLQPWQLPAPEPTDPVLALVTIDQLVEAGTRPARTLLRDRLDVRLPGEVAAPDPHIPLAVSPLDSAGMGRRLLDRYRTALATDPSAAADWDGFSHAQADAWFETEALSGHMPPRALARPALETVAGEIDLMFAALKGVAPVSRTDVLGAVGTQEVDIPLTAVSYRHDVAAGPVRLVDRVEHITHQPTGLLICQVYYERAKARQDLRAAVSLAAAVLATDRTDWMALVVSRAARSTERPAPRLYGVQGTLVEARESAQRLLDHIAGLRVAALSVAVPVFEESSRRLVDSGTNVLNEDELMGTGYARGDLDDRDVAFVWEGFGHADIQQLRPELPARHLWEAVNAFVVPMGKS